MPTDTTILLVEDNDDLADLYRHYLADTYQVSVVQTGREAINQASPTFDLLIIDYKLPDLSGYEVRNRLRTSGLTMPVVMISGTDPGLISHDDAPAAWLTKPFYKEKLEQTVQSVLSTTESNP
jgi:DNA-binding response OmpR family regulator